MLSKTQIHVKDKHANGDIIDIKKVKNIKIKESPKQKVPQKLEPEPKTDIIDNGLENVVKVFATQTLKGYIPNKPDKQNQDIAFVCENFGNIKNNWFFGVCDGHGVNGHFASDHIKRYLPTNIELLDYMAMRQKFQELSKQVDEGETNQFF